MLILLNGMQKLRRRGRLYLGLGLSLSVLLLALAPAALAEQPLQWPEPQAGSPTAAGQPLSLQELTASLLQYYRPEEMGWDWGEGLFLYALTRLLQAEALPEQAPEIQRFLARYYQHHLQQGLPEIDWSDKCAPGLAATWMWQQSQAPAYRQIAEAVSHYLKQAKPLPSGGLNHLGHWWPAAVYPRSIWVDSLMMYNLFALHWGQQTQDPWLLDFAANQPLRFAEKLQDSSGLWKHAWLEDYGVAVPQEPVYWLRGNGWALAGLAEVISHLPEQHPARAALLDRWQRTLQAILPWQNPQGLWHTVINRPWSSYPETSGSALVAYAIYTGVQAGWLSAYYLPVADQTMQALQTYLVKQPDGSLLMTGISGPTMPSESLAYHLVPQGHNLPYGTAALLLAQLAAEQVSRPAPKPQN